MLRNYNRFLLLLLLTLACLHLPVPVARAAPQWQGTSATLQIINQSSHTVCSIYVSAIMESEWGDDYLVDDQLAPNATLDIALLSGTYDVLLLDCNGEKVYAENGIEISSRYTLTFSDRDGKAQGCDNLYQTGVEAYNRSHYDAAEDSYQRALLCFQDAGDRAGEGRTLNNLAAMYRSQGRYQEALEAYEQALAIRREVGDRAGESTTLNNIAGVYDRQERYQEALEAYEQALAIRREVGDRAREGATLNNIAGVYDSQEQYQEALEAYELALAIRREVGDRAGEGATLNNIAGVYDRQEQYQEALEAYELALAIRREVGDRAGEGATLNNIAGVYRSQGQYQEALEAYEQALAIRREVGDRAGEGATLNNIAGVYDRQERYQEALEAYEQTLAIRREVGDRAGEGTTLNNIAAVYDRQGRYQEALEAYEQTLAIRREVGDRAGEGATLNNIAAVYDRQGQYQEALEAYEQTLAIRREVGDRAGEGATLDNIAGVYDSQGQYQEALEAYEQTLAIRREVGDRAGEGTTLNNIAGVYDRQEQYQEALEAYELALAIRREVGDRAREGATLNNIAGVYRSQERYQEALEAYELALAIRREVGDRAGEGATLNNIAAVYRSQGQYQKALEAYEQALAIRREVGDRAGEGTTLNNIAGVYDRQGQYQEALKAYELALAIRREVGDRAGEGATLNNIAAVYRRQRQYQEALEAYEQALAIRREAGDRAGEGATLNNIAAVYRSQGSYQEALEAFGQAADVLESLRATAGSEQAPAAFIDQYTSAYDGMVQAAIDLNRPSDAFLASERGRARAFLDSLATEQVQLKDVRNAELLAHEQAAYATRQTAQDALAAAHGLTPPDPAFIEEREAELENADKELAQVQDAIAAQSEQLAALIPGRSTVLTLAEVQALLDKETTLVSYWMLEDKTLAFVITSADFAVVELPEATPEAVQGAVQSIYQWSNRENPHPSSLRNLYAWLVAPLASHLTTSHVAIVPHQQLHYVPFAALTDGEHYFGQEHILSLLPSATALRLLQANAQTAQQAGWQKVLVFGNPATDLPPLPYAEDEAQEIGALLQTPVYTGTRATEARLWQQVEGSVIVHLAAPSSYNQADPLYCVISLSAGGDHDGRLETHEIYALPLKGTELVTLSACETSVGALSRGDEVVGLTHAFFFAGAPTLLSTLWQVDDAARGALMAAFYRNWREQGMDKAAALQAAQSEVAANPQWRSPFYWAAFVLHGHPGEERRTNDTDWLGDTCRLGSMASWNCKERARE